MALGCVLWVWGISFLLFGGTLGLPAIKGYRYPYRSDSRNIGDDAEDEALMSDDWQAPNRQPSRAAYPNYNKPSAARQPVSTQQNVPSAPVVESIVNSESRDWGTINSQAPLTFPLSHNKKPSAPARPQQGPNSGSKNAPKLVYEDVFQYSSDNPAQFPVHSRVSNPAGGAGQVRYVGYSNYPSEPSFQNSPANAGTETESPSSETEDLPNESEYGPEEEGPMRVSEPFPPPPLPPLSYIIQSRSGYQRVRHIFNKARYSPELAPPPVLRPVLTAKPMATAANRPADPVAVKDPKRPLRQG